MAHEPGPTTSGLPDPSPADVPTDTTSSITEKVIDGVIGKVLSHVDARTVYGDPVTQGDRTVIPVAKVSSAYGFGAGSGQGSDAASDQKGSGSGSGGGGKIDVVAIGYVEVTPEASTFVPIVNANAIALRAVTLVGIGLIIGILGAALRGRDDD